MNIKEFNLELLKLNIKLDKEKLDKLEKFYELLVDWNEKINLTTITNKEEVYLKHFYDSLTLIKVVDLTKDLEILDVGTGAGFPGIVLKIVFPNLKITLLDSTSKRINYLNEIIKDLDLKEIKTECMRIEDYSRINKNKYDVVVARAVAHLGILIETIMPTVKLNGYFVAMKSNVENEILESKNILNQIGASIIKCEEFKLPKENSLRNLVKIQKEHETPNKFPRRFDKIKKEYKN